MRLRLLFAAIGLVCSWLWSEPSLAQMNWMFDQAPDPAAPPVSQVNFAALDDLALLDSGDPLPAPVPPPAEVPALNASTGAPASGMTEPLPLAEQTQRWYSYPWSWLTTGWNNHAEFGLNGADGNTNTLSLQTGVELKRQTDQYTFVIDVDYFRTKAGGLLTQDAGRADFGLDRMIAGSPWSAFGKLGLEWNEFRPFDIRVNLNSGAAYHFIRDDTTTVVARFGAGASKQIGAPDDSWIPEALFGLEAEHQLNRRQKLKAKVDYFPDWRDFSRYRLVSDLSWETLLDEQDNLSLKLATTNRYDTNAQGALPRDLFYSMLLLYKF